LAAAGSDGVREVIGTLTAELRQGMASVGAARIADLNPTMVRTPI
jgi:isopentenyl diphosphate isomerase/L-lactate dehydrogenase-like FMN-dependent dehydrogenase